MKPTTDLHQPTVREQLVVLPLQAWNQFWFTPICSSRLDIPRLSIGLVIALWFLSYFSGLDAWFGAAGVLSNATAAQVIDFEDTRPIWHWSVLWLTSSTWVYQAWITVGGLLALTVAFGYGGRIAIVALLFFQAGWIHRILWLQGPFEPLSVCLALSLLVAEPGHGMRLPSRSSHNNTSAWNQVSLRLIQIHLWLFLLAGLFFQASVEAWWQGEAIWWLAANQRSMLLTMEQLSANGWLVNLLTHLVILLEFATLLLLTRTSTRTLGILTGLILFASVAVLWDQVLLALLYAAALTAFLPSIKYNPKPS